MQFVAEQSHLDHEMRIAASLLPKRSLHEIYESILIEAHGNALKIIANDGNIEVQQDLNATIKKEGSVAVPGRKLADIIKRMPSDAQIKIALNSDNGRVSVTAGRSRYALPTRPAEQFPRLAQENYSAHITTTAADLNTWIDRTAFSASTDDHRHYLKGVYLHHADGFICCVSTDGHRLAFHKTNNKTLDVPGVIIPIKTLSLMQKALPENADAEVFLGVSESAIQFSYNATVISSRVIDGKYPDYTRVIPRDNPHTLRTNRDALIKAVERVTSISDERGRSVVFSILSQDLIISTPAKESERGEGIEEIPCTWTHDTDFQTGINGAYLLDVLKRIEAPEVEMRLSVPTVPALIKDPDTPESLFVIMPMRIN